jgi:adenylate cyclase
VSGLTVPLESILPALQGTIPSPFATCSRDGTPNVTYMSIVRRVDRERVALSRQFFNKSRANLDANPQSQVWVVDPRDGRQYVLDLVYLHTESDGPTFEALRSDLDAIARSSGAADVFRLRGVDIHRVVRCEPVAGATGGPAAAGAELDDLRRLDDFIRRLAGCTAYEDATSTALQALDDLFGIAYSVLFVADERGDRLFAAATNGYPARSAGAEVVLGTGVVGIAAARRQVVTVPNLSRARVMQTAVQERAGLDDGPAIPVPSLDGVQSAAAVPLVVHGALVGVLGLESRQPGDFGAHNERILRIVGGHLATALAMLERDRTEAPPSAAPRAPAPPAGPSALEVLYYQADDSVFVDQEYVIKGVPGRILWKVLREHAADGRVAFSNRELRLDESLGLPAGNDNLEARLLVLRRRLAAGAWGIGLERVARGRLELSVARPLELTEVPTSGPMRAAHDAP